MTIYITRRAGSAALLVLLTLAGAAVRGQIPGSGTSQPCAPQPRCAPASVNTAPALIVGADNPVAGMAHAGACTPITTSRFQAVEHTDNIDRPGQYCLERDVKSTKRHDFGGERAFFGALMRIQSSHVDIDLRGFTLGTETLNMPGVALSPPYGIELRQVALHNGRMISRSGTAIGFPELKGTTLADFRAIHRTPSFAEDGYAKFRDGWLRVSASMQPSDILVDRVSVQSKTRTDVRPCPECFGVALKGRRNVIRNSRIEISNGQAGVLFAGPDNLIERCTIVFKGKAATAAAAAIKLYAAHNTVIRDNDIVIESDDDTAPVAILLTDSKNVTLEGNRFYGVKTITKMDEQSGYAVERGNQSLSRFKALFLK